MPPPCADGSTATWILRDPAGEELSAPAKASLPALSFDGLDNPTEQPVGFQPKVMQLAANPVSVGALAVSVSLRLRFLLLGLLIISPGGSAI